MRRECLDHVIVLGERHLRRVLTEYLGYYHGSRTHLSLEKRGANATTRATRQRRRRDRVPGSRGYTIATNDAPRDVLDRRTLVA